MALDSFCCFWEIFAAVVLFLLLIPAFRRFRSGHVTVDPEGRAVLITGCDTGFGNMLAHRLLEMGFVVFATCLYPDGEGARALLSRFPSDRVKVVRFDVTSDKEMEEVKQYVQSNLPEKGLWGIVNNAGISVWGISEWISMHRCKQVVEVNLLGTIRTTLAFAPLVRKSKGRMVFLSSMNAHVPYGSGIYGTTKAGIQTFCDSLRFEMKKFGVKVSIILPGNYSPSTNIQPQKTPKEVWNSIPEDAKDVYDLEYVWKATNFVNKQLLTGHKNGYEVIDAIVNALTSDSPKARYLVANLKEKIILFICLYFPTSVIEAIISL
uniref:Uncharacterized protein n=1 Tax=Leptobrachium leishanense TaxID=445787 RepID=A0A8C5MRV8_9ANUR